ncbi:alpha- and gamma-adaptin-binding protein p34-like [Copidosoma floridanum]|uniref:alpha- and gamma-adaptin-binding protein p34-like n=1 Tax=Copidosoma floridanum TaxID=29053 RepID=UPI0006C9D4A2|nr:alpha- and gamma-adaptin-binding protein p34-like [Copidosoma floridanum]
MDNEKAEMDLPRVLIVSSKMDNAKEIANSMKAKYLLRQGDVEQYLLDIDNKYYTAQILLCTTENLSIDASDFEALLLHHDFETEDTLKMVEEQITAIVTQSTAEVLLLLSNSIPNVSIREKVIGWCAAKKFELIELDPTDKEIMDLEEDQSNYGIARIIEVLETHAWPNMNLKVDRKNTEVPQSEINKVEDQLENVQLNTSKDFSECLQMESILDGIMNNEDADFGELFSHLKAMKEQTAQMPSNQRKVAAEQLVTAFWKAIGGDPSEIDDENIE